MYIPTIQNVTYMSNIIETHLFFFSETLRKIIELFYDLKKNIFVLEFTCSLVIDLIMRNIFKAYF